MKNTASVALFGGVALGLTLACSARAEPTTQNDQGGSEVQRGLPAEQVSPKAYWGLGKANAAHGEPPRD